MLPTVVGMVEFDEGSTIGLNMPTSEREYRHDLRSGLSDTKQPRRRMTGEKLAGIINFCESD